MLRATFALLLVLAPAALADDLEQQVKSLVGVFAAVEANAADPISSEQAFFQGAIPGMLRRLDPHSVFFEPAQFEQLRQLETSTSKGFGSVVSVLPGRVIVLQTLPGTPSAKSGLGPGDEILAVNGIRLDRLDSEQLIGLLGQSRQRPARLDVRRPGNARVLQFTLTPEEMQSPSVERAFLLKPGIGYLRVASFDEKTGAEVAAAIEKLGGRNLQGLVLDLRNNPGGVLGAALHTAALFLKPGLKLLTVRGRAVSEKDEKVPSDAQPYEFPMAVLINGKSASASEIVAGALQDHDRAQIVGEASFGKGLVQSVFPLSQSAGLALTTALYYTPSGRSIQKPFDAAQFELGAAAAHINAQSDFRTDAGRIVHGGGGIQPDAVVPPAQMSRFRAVLDGSAAFTSFATEYTQAHKITESFEVTGSVLDEFQVYLSGRNIRPALSEWSSERDFIQNRLKTEIFNQSLGVAKGDEVEAERDPQIQRGLEIVTRVRPAE
ncbi:MAG: S41 family peptidase [Candidatus Solibacter usitatus]|nr:S41 family peptidase [Candidatus Solibacter usitatus]